MKIASAFFLVGCLTVSLCVPSAHAQRASKVTGRMLGNMCSTNKSNGNALCDAYLSGVMDSEVWAKKYDSYANDAGAPVAFCVPVTETTSQVRGKFVNWLHEHNDALTQPAGKAAYRALHDAYPCHMTAGDKNESRYCRFS